MRDVFVNFNLSNYAMNNPCMIDHLLKKFTLTMSFLKTKDLYLNPDHKPNLFAVNYQNPYPYHKMYDIQSRKQSRQHEPGTGDA